MTHLRVAAVEAVFEEGEEAFMEVVCAPEDFTAEAPVAVPFMLGVSTVVAATA
jgi:hypothetical protein